MAAITFEQATEKNVL